MLAWRIGLSVAFRLRQKRRFMRWMRRPAKSLWSSGNDIKSWLHFGELSVANGRVYIGTWDGILYCYGIKK